MKKSIKDIFDERNKMLDEIIPLLFKAERRPPEELVKKILIQKVISKNIKKLGNTKGIKVNVKDVFDKYMNNVELVEAKNKKDNLICPLSQGLIEDPWEGICGHIFERKIVNSYMAVGKQCPVIGCNKILKEKE